MQAGTRRHDDNEEGHKEDKEDKGMMMPPPYLLPLEPTTEMSQMTDSIVWAPGKSFFRLFVVLF